MTNRDPRFTLLEGDCVKLMASLEPASIDAIVTDPPYGLEFMGEEWDRFRADDSGTPRRPGERKNRKQIDPDATSRKSLAFQMWSRTWALEAKRVLKPGGHLLAFGGPRTSHRLVCGLEDAGFEIRDSIMWLYGSGFPKSLNVAKAIERRRISSAEPRTASSAASEAVPWHGWGTALKPAHEPIVVARRPLTGTVAENVLGYGTGAVNIDACRICVADKAYARNHTGDRGHDGPRDRGQATDLRPGGGSASDAGRWPANVALDERAAAELDEQCGVLASGLVPAGTKRKGLGYRGGLGSVVLNETYGDTGGASRFYYCAKASRGERNAGLESFEQRDANKWNNGGIGRSRREAGASFMQNIHPTVKPINLMRWLARLVSPPLGVILDPFAGSGTTGVAAVLEGFEFLGIERDSEYCRIAEARCRFWASHAGRDVKEVLARRKADRRG